VYVYADPCHWAAAPSNPLIQPSVGDIVAALAAQPMRSATAPTDRYANTLGLLSRWPGKAIELTVPRAVNLANCNEGQYRSWGPENNARSHQGPGQRDLVWAVNIGGAGVEGVRAAPPGGLIIDAASFGSTPNQVISEIENILASIVVGHWG